MTTKTKEQAGAPAAGVATTGGQNISDPSLAEFGKVATIVDPDGYTNVRSAGNPSSRVITRVDSGSIVRTYEQPGNWWRVLTSSGTVGYVHKSRLSLRD